MVVITRFTKLIAHKTCDTMFESHIQAKLEALCDKVLGGIEPAGDLSPRQHTDWMIAVYQLIHCESRSGHETNVPTPREPREKNGEGRGRRKKKSKGRQRNRINSTTIK